MQAKLKGNNLDISGELKRKKFKTGRKGWYCQEVITVGGKEVKLNLIAYELTPGDPR